MDNAACHTMDEGEILNTNHPKYRIYKGILYGDRVQTAKLSKRVGCSIKHLQIRLQFHYEHDTLKAVEAGVRTDPSLVLEGKVFLEGLMQAEEITEVFERLLEQ